MVLFLVFEHPQWKFPSKLDNIRIGTSWNLGATSGNHPTLSQPITFDTPGSIWDTKESNELWHCHLDIRSAAADNRFPLESPCPFLLYIDAVTKPPKPYGHVDCL